MNFWVDRSDDRRWYAASDGDGAAFTERVLTALPPPASVTQRAARRRRSVLVGAAAVLGCGFAWLCGGPGLAASALEISRLTTHAAVQQNSLHAIVVEVLAAASSIAMLWFSGRRNLRRWF